MTCSLQSRAPSKPSHQSPDGDLSPTVTILPRAARRVAHLVQHRSLRRVPLRDPRADVAERPPGARALLARRCVRYRGSQHRREANAHEDAHLHRRV